MSACPLPLSSPQVLDLSHNKLTSLPESLLQKTKLEIFKMAFNNLQEIPVKTLNPVQSSLKHLDLSHNNISLISDSLLNQVPISCLLLLPNCLCSWVWSSTSSRSCS